MDATQFRYTSDHEWVSQPVDGICTVGISDYAQQELGDIVYVEFPDPPQIVAQGESCATLESVKAASDIYAPISGIIQEINSDLEDNPQLLNQSPCSEGWIFKLKVDEESDIESLMDHAAYLAFLEQA
ncbi:glycine cleavage system protein GcvH [bacterium]|jgi:glycine cleavage system H protein|nr:glycine cleavage system protein GcvH [bacterium]